MDEVRVKNFRCFREEQRVRLAPLTLLVGENSTGKTSLMAMIRALAGSVRGFDMPDFKENPYDLGSFEEIVHNRGSAKGSPAFFSGGFSIANTTNHDPTHTGKPFSYDLTFGRAGSYPVPVRRTVRLGEARIEESMANSESHLLRVATSRGNWEARVQSDGRVFINQRPILMPLNIVLYDAVGHEEGQLGDSFAQIEGSPPIGSEDFEEIQEVAISPIGAHGMGRRLHASAPIRSQPRRTYEPARVISDPEGSSVPMYLAEIQSQEKDQWKNLKQRIESFGRSSGLFDEIDIGSWGDGEGDPFQVQVRKYSGRTKGPRRNIVDVGYGVSQALPLVTELLRPERASMFLLQQPEVHLHPSAQAALGSLFCQVAAPDGPQLIVETHSDHIIDRVRMDVLEGASGLRPEDVSILYFERGNLEVTIHSLEIDKSGNVIGAPESYRRFFAEELDRSLFGGRTIPTT